MLLPCSASKKFVSLSLSLSLLCRIYSLVFSFNSLHLTRRTRSHENSHGANSVIDISQVGVLIEEPFPMLALDDMCNLVRLNIQQAIDTEGVIQETLAAKRRHHCCNRSQNGRPEN